MPKNKLINTQSGIIVHNYKIKISGVKKKIIYHFSDLHLTEYDSFSNEAERHTAIEQSDFWKTGREYFAKTYNEPLSAEQCVDTRTHFANLLSEANNGDALIITGDVFDYISGANLRTADLYLKSFSKPFMTVCGNHENPKEIPDNHIFSKAKNSIQILDLGDIVVFGIDNSKGNILAEQNEQLKKALLLEKPVIIAMHIPVMTEENKDKFEKIEEYYWLNNKSAAKEVLDFIDIIKENADKIIAVLAGHLHFMNNSEITSGVTQYVSSQALLGNINRYEIGD